MPISFHVDPQLRLIRTTNVGVITPPELTTYVEPLLARRLLDHAGGG